MLFRINKSKGAFFTKVFKLIIYWVSGVAVVYSATPETHNLHYINLNLKMDTVAFREWYKNPLTSKNNYISEVYVPLGSDSPCVTISVPIIDNGQVVGVLGADLELSEIQ